LSQSLRSAGRRARSLLGWLPYGSLVAVLLIPTVCFLLLAFFPGAFGVGAGGFSLASFRTAYQSYVFTALVNSLWVGVAASLIALAIAVVLAWLCERRQIAGARLWRAGIWALILVPTYLTALGLEDLLGPAGVIAQVSGWNPVALDHLLLGPAGVVAVLSLRGVAFAYFAVSGVIASLGIEMEDAARVHGLPRWRTVAIQLGSLSPALMAGFVLVFAETVSDFGVASTLAANAHFPVITYTIFTFTAALPIDFPAAAAISWSLIGFFGVVLVFQRRVLRGRSFSAGGRTTRSPTNRAGNQGGQRFLAPLGAGLFFIAALIGPIAGIVVSSLLPASAFSGSVAAGSGGSGFTLENYRSLFHTAGMLDPVWLSLRLGLAGATGAVAVGLGINLWAQYRGGSRVNALVDLGLVAIIGLPSIVLGAGFVFFYDLPAVYRMLPIYDTSWLLLVGYVVGFAPIAIRMLHGPLVQAGRSQYDAARVHGSAAMRAWRRTVLARIWKTVVLVWLFLVATIMFELPLSEILQAPSGAPLAVAVAVTLKSQVATGTALTVIAIVAVLALLGAVLGLQAAVSALRRAALRRHDAALVLEFADASASTVALEGTR
jgi:iron(III) transport system permease protein